MGRINLPSGGGGNPLFSRKRHRINGNVSGILFEGYTRGPLGYGDDFKSFLIYAEGYIIEYDLKGNQLARFATNIQKGCIALTEVGDKVVAMLNNTIVKFTKNGNIVSSIVLPRIGDWGSKAWFFKDRLYVGYFDQSNIRFVEYKLDGSLISERNIYVDDTHAYRIHSLFYVNNDIKKAIVFYDRYDSFAEHQITFKIILYDFETLKFDVTDMSNEYRMQRHMIINGERKMLKEIEKMIKFGYTADISPIFLLDDVYLFFVGIITQREHPKGYRSFVVLVDSKEVDNFRAEILLLDNHHIPENALYFKEKNLVVFEQFQKIYFNCL